MRALVTGANGFIGSHLVDALLAQGARVRASVRPGAALGWLSPEAERLTGEIVEPAHALRAARGMDVVFHVAGEYVPQDPRVLEAANVTTTASMLRASIAAGVERLVFVSSFAAAGPSLGDIPRCEESPPAPVNPYGRLKLQAEGLLLDARRELGVTILRPPAVVGPRDPNFLHMFQILRRTGAFPKFGPYTRFTNLVHVADLCAVMIAAAASPRTAGRAYFVAHPQVVSYDEVIAEAGRAVGVSPVRRVHLPNAVLAGAVALSGAWERLTGRIEAINCGYLSTVSHPRWTACMERLQADLGAAPPTTVSEMIADACAWYVAQGLVDAPARPPGPRLAPDPRRWAPAGPIPTLQEAG